MNSIPTKTDLNVVLLEARDYTDALFALVRPDSLYERPIPERHRIIFYLGHLEAFDWNLVGQTSVAMEPFQPECDKLFAFGIDPPSDQLPQDKPSDWPSLREIQQYTGRLRQALDRVLKEVPEQILHVALEHRLMHVETLAYILHQLPTGQKRVSTTQETLSEFPPSHRMIDIPDGIVTLGQHRSEDFGWDNEYDRHEVYVPTFSISKYKVTNRQYLEFVQAGTKPPYFWASRGKEWFYRASFGDIPLALDWPVYVTQQEATSYAEWAGMALPTEAQYHRAAYGTWSDEERLYPWGNVPLDIRQGPFNFLRWDPISVSATPLWDSAFGVSQLLGNGWEWTSTVFHPFSGFQPYTFYPGYSGRFFDGEHYVLKGASPLTADRLTRRSFRNWFRPSYPYGYFGFRCVKN